MEIIKTVDTDQGQIIKSIITLYCPQGIECDSTYSVGNFYKKTGIAEPQYKFDLNPQVEGVVQANAESLPLENASISSYMFDPPFVAAIPKEQATGIITTRFGYYRNIQNEMWNFYSKAIQEAYRVLKEDGVFIFKCQDTVDSSKQYFSHCFILNEAIFSGFYPKDLFVLVAKNRLIGKTHHNQQHARKFHSYFWVFVKQQSKVDYRIERKHNNEQIMSCSVGG